MNMRYSMLLAAALGTAVTAAGTTSALGAEKHRLALIGGMIVQPHTRDVETPFWARQIPAITGGAIEVQIRGWDELGIKGTEVFHFVQQGTFSGGTLSSSRASGDAPINEGLDLAGLSPTVEDHWNAIAVFSEAFEKWYEEKYRLKVIGIWQYPPQLLLCRNNLDGLADMKGRKVRVQNSSQADFVSGLGAVPIYMASPEVQSALHNRVLDCGITSALSAYKQGWHEGAKFLYPLAVNWNPQASFLNLDTWNSFSPELQSLLERELRVFAGRSRQHNLMEEQLGIACMTGQGICTEGKPADMVLIPVKPEDRDLLKKALVDRVAPEWAKRCGVECVALWNKTIGKSVGLEISAK